MLLTAEGKGNLDKEKWGSPGVTAALHIKLTVYGAEEYSIIIKPLAA